MRFGKAGVLGLALLAMTAVFSGCVVFDGPITAKQVGKKPKVKVEFTVCRSSEGCPRLGNSDSTVQTGTVKLLLGFRVPKGTRAPQTIKPLSTAAVAGPVPPTAAVLRRNQDYKRELGQKAPKGKRFKYFGYESDPFQAEDSGAADFEVKFKLPKRFERPRFKVRPVVGGISGDGPFETCGPDPFELFEETVICIDDPSPEAMQSIKAKVRLKD
jgi:hypothetical protein